MKRIALLLSGILAVVIAPSAASLQVDATRAGSTKSLEYVAEDPALERLVGTPGPAVNLHMLGGGRIDLLSLYGNRPVYLKFWATYCLPCRAQMPGFERIYESTLGRMEVVAINAGVGDDPDKVRAFVASAGLRMPVAIDDGSLGAWLKLDATPLHVLIGLDGRIAYVGHQDGPRLDAALRRVLAAKPSKAPLVTSAVPQVPVLRAGETVPSIALRSATGTPVQLGGGPTGRPRALLFTATWCEDYLLHTEPTTARECRDVREQVARIAGTGDIEWLGIVSHLWTSASTLDAYERRTRQPISFAVDTEGTAFRVFGIQRLPALVVIDSHGRLLRVVESHPLDVAGALAVLKTRE